ncbi:hypothetical protein HanPSC8_Chr15g0680471 [Helianthus annuus]|nr:hypothetical protein HanPSC8_Chr15g0680471 [Helianthus annuus]
MKSKMMSSYFDKIRSSNSPPSHNLKIKKLYNQNLSKSIKILILTKEIHLECSRFAEHTP